MYTNGAGNTTEALVIPTKIIMVLVKLSSKWGTGRPGHADSQRRKKNNQENKRNMQKILDENWRGIFFIIKICGKQ